MRNEHFTGWCWGWRSSHGVSVLVTRAADDDGGGVMLRRERRLHCARAFHFSFRRQAGVRERLRGVGSGETCITARFAKCSRCTGQLEISLPRANAAALRLTQPRSPRPTSYSTDVPHYISITSFTSLSLTTASSSLS